MTAAHIYFGKPMNSDTGAALVHAARCLMGERPNPTVPFSWDELHISFASGGGDVIPALAAFNELNRLSLGISTHNSGAVDSAVILPFMVGKTRTASPHSSFFFHQIQWTFTSNAGLQTTLVNESATLMEYYTEIVATIVSDRSKLSKSDVKNKMRDGTLVTSKEGLAMGLIHNIAEPAVPQAARTWQV